MILSVLNNSGATLARGDVIKQIGTSVGGLPIVMQASAATVTGKTALLGVLVSDLNNGAVGLVVISGAFKFWNTSGYGLNDPVYLSNIGTMSPIPGTIPVIIGKVLSSNINGCVFIGSFYSSVECC